MLKQPPVADPMPARPVELRRVPFSEYPRWGFVEDGRFYPFVYRGFAERWAGEGPARLRLLTSVADGETQLLPPDGTGRDLQHPNCPCAIPSPRAGTVAALLAQLMEMPIDAEVYTTDGNCDDEIEVMPQRMPDGRVRL